MHVMDISARPLPKVAWRFAWLDRAGGTGRLTRARVAYYLRAARSRRDPIQRIEGAGYLIGRLALFHDF